MIDPVLESTDDMIDTFVDLADADTENQLLVTQEIISRSTLSADYKRANTIDESGGINPGTPRGDEGRIRPQTVCDDGSSVNTHKPERPSLPPSAGPHGSPGTATNPERHTSGRISGWSRVPRLDTHGVRENSSLSLSSPRAPPAETTSSDPVAASLEDSGMSPFRSVWFNFFSYSV